MLEIRKVTRRFGKNVAVDSVDLEIAAGQMVGVIGRSGAPEPAWSRVGRAARPWPCGT